MGEEEKEYDVCYNGQPIGKAKKVVLIGGTGKTFKMIDSIPLLTEAEISVSFNIDSVKALEEQMRLEKIFECSPKDSKIENRKKSRNGFKKKRFWE